MPARERVSGLLALGSAIGVVAFLVSSSPRGAPGGETFETEPSTRRGAGRPHRPDGSDAPGSTPLMLETAPRAELAVAGRGESEDGGEFRLEGRVVGVQGRCDPRSCARRGSCCPVCA